MTDRRFALAEHLLETKPWSLFAMVEMGPDRMHHGFWKYMDPEHRKHEPGNPYETRSSTTTATVDGLDREAARARRTRTPSSSSSPTTARSGSTAESASTSGCGARVCSRRSPSRTACPRCATSASTGRARRRGARAATTHASSSTSHGREPEGTIAPEEYEDVRDDLARRIAAIPDDAGNPIPTAVYKPEELYGEPQGVAPDLIVVFGDLSGARSGRSAATRASRRSRTTPARTTRTTHRTACTSSPARGSSAAGATTRTCSTSLLTVPRTSRDRGAAGACAEKASPLSSRAADR